MVALIVCLFEVASFAERAEAIQKFAWQLCETVAKMTWKCMKNPAKSSENLSKIHENPSKNVPRSEAQEKTTKIVKKVTPGIASRIIDLEPKVVQNDIKKSLKNRCRKNIPKWCQKDQKRLESGAKIGPKIMKNRCRKRIGKNHEKAWKMKVPNLENHCFS